MYTHDGILLPPKKEDNPVHATTRIKLKDIILNEIRKPQKDKFIIYHLLYSKEKLYFYQKEDIIIYKNSQTEMNLRFRYWKSPA